MKSEGTGSKRQTRNTSANGSIDFGQTNSSVSYSLMVGDLTQAIKFQNFTAQFGTDGKAPYLVRTPNLMVTSATSMKGVTLYTRLDLHGGFWSTVILSASTPDANLLGAVTSSITFGQSSQITLTPHGVLDQYVELTLRLSNDPRYNKGAAAINSSPSEPPANNVATPPPASEAHSVFTGSGIYVTSTGYVLTNSHVVKNCVQISVDQMPATLVKSSDEFDLALLKTGTISPHPFATFSGEPAKLNSDVTVVGYPLADLLGGVNVTRGEVSSLTGLVGNPIQMQITAPVQEGNSGGPVVSSTGAVVGVVVSKLNAQRMASATGDIPQNVNFAIRGEIAKLFLTVNGVEPQASNNPDVLAPETLADTASKFTAFVRCEQ